MISLRSTGYSALAGFAGLALGTGLLRYAYTPIIPALVHAGWITVPQAAWLGSANFWGGLFGMIIALRASLRFDRLRILQLAIPVGVISLFACAWDLGFTWLAFWRFIGGLMGAQIMALLPGCVMNTVPPHRHRLVGGITMSGMGFALIPSLLIRWTDPFGPAADWILCGFFGILCGVVTFPFVINRASPTRAPCPPPLSLGTDQWRNYLFFMAAYTMAGVALIPHALYLSDYLVRGLGATPGVAAALFSWFAGGLGVGSLVAGWLAHRMNTRAAIVALTACGLVGNAIIIFSGKPTTVSISSFFFALWAGGAVALASLRCRDIVGLVAHARFWPMMCIAYATGMWVASTAFAAMLQAGARYNLFFWATECFIALYLVLAMKSYGTIDPSRTSKSELSAQ